MVSWLRFLMRLMLSWSRDSRKYIANSSDHVIKVVKVD